MTAVEWLIEQIKKEHPFWTSIFEQAKEMEKKQITDAYKFGLSDEYVIGSDKYFNETYGSKGSDEYPLTEGTMAICNDIISSQAEISDEEIDNAAQDPSTDGYSFQEGAKWYREQLKQRQ